MLSFKDQDHCETDRSDDNRVIVMLYLIHNDSDGSKLKTDRSFYAQEKSNNIFL